MIISCERCNTRFHLDEARLPAGGARVRCSQCKHAFFVRGAGMTPEQVIHAAAAEAAAESQRGAAEPDVDPDALAEAEEPQAADDYATGRAEEPEPPGAAVEQIEEAEESDWQFNLDDSAGEPSGAGIVTGSETPEPLGDSGPDLSSLGADGSEADEAPAPDENALSFDDLGTPDSWDLLSEESPEQAPGPSEEAPLFGDEADEASAVEEPAPPPVRDRRRRRALREGDRGGFAWSEALRLGGWLSAVLLVGLGLGFAVQRALQPAPSIAWAPVEVAGLVAEGVRARRVENLQAGPLTVVTGTLRNAGRSTVIPGRLLKVTLEDAGGLRTRVAGPPLSDLYLREADPIRVVEALRRSAETAAWQRVASGATVQFQAVFPSAPTAPGRVVLGDGPAPRPDSEAPTSAPTSEQDGAGATSPSPPTPPPSSG